MKAPYTEARAYLTTKIAFHVAIGGQDLGHFMPLRRSAEGVITLVGEEAQQLLVQLDQVDLISLNSIAAYERWAFVGREVATLPPPGAVPSERGAGGNEEDRGTSVKALARIALTFAAELQALLDLMARCEPDVPAAVRATDEEWLDRTASATEILTSGLTAMRRDLKASGLTAERIEGDLKVAAWAPMTTTLSSRAVSHD